MMNLLASVFAGFGMLFGGLFGGHHAPPGDMASSTPGQRMGTTTPWGNRDGMGSTSPDHMGMMGMPGVFGKVVSVSGTTLTVTGRGPMNSATTTYSVDASSAKVLKSGSKTASSTPITISGIKTGDTVIVVGKVSGTSIVATMIIDGLPNPSMMMHPGMPEMSGDMHGMKGMPGMAPEEGSK